MIQQVDSRLCLPGLRTGTRAPPSHRTYCPFTFSSLNEPNMRTKKMAGLSKSKGQTPVIIADTRGAPCMVCTTPIPHQAQQGQRASSYFSSSRSRCRSSWVAMGSDTSEAMLGVGSLMRMWLGEQAALACRLEQLLARSLGSGGLASTDGVLSSSPGLPSLPLPGTGGEGPPSAVRGAADI